jgi:hypothetical protein
MRKDKDSIIIDDMKELETPEFIRIRKKKTKRDSSYSEAEIQHMSLQFGPQPLIVSSS